jgi:hypothetical protein
VPNQQCDPPCHPTSHPESVPEAVKLAIPAVVISGRYPRTCVADCRSLHRVGFFCAKPKETRAGRGPRLASASTGYAPARQAAPDPGKR